MTGKMKKPSKAFGYTILILIVVLNAVEFYSRAVNYRYEVGRKGSIWVYTEIPIEAIELSYYVVRLLSCFLAFHGLRKVSWHF
jgi:hypothetical protein